jgi:hypothetical protein
VNPSRKGSSMDSTFGCAKNKLFEELPMQFRQ